MLIQRYKKNPQRATLYIAFTNLSWSMLAFCASYIYLFAGIDLAFAVFSQVVMYGSLLSGVIFTYMFARKAFFTEEKKFLLIYVILGIILIVFLAIPGSSFEDHFPDSIGIGPDDTYPALILTSEFGLVVAVYIFPTLVGVMISAFRVASRLGDKLYARGFQFIGIGEALILGSFACDTIATLFIADVVGYAIALYSQWTLNVVASILVYVGYTMPGWFQRMYGGKTGHVTPTK